MSHPVYPRPDFDRSHAWLSLDGPWAFACDADGSGYRMDWHLPKHDPYTATIQVPFPWESRLSGVQVEWMPIGWYRRTVERPAGWEGLRTVLHVGAAHYHTTVWMDGRLVGDHTGGYLPFAFDITDFLSDGRGQLTIRVEAPLDKRTIPHGKQRSRPSDDWDDCAFTASSGIWQNVWLEARPATHIAHAALQPTAALDAIVARVQVAGPHCQSATLTATVDGATIAVQVGADGWAEAYLPIRRPRLWSPSDPYLYTVTWHLQSSDGADQVGTYTGLRRIEVQGNCLILNGQRLYVRGALDQGFWPDGIHAAPDDNALRLDVELARRAGFNLLRKHIKLEHPRWLYWCDVLGLLVWEEPPCYGRFTPGATAEFEAMLPAMVARDGNHPSMIIWGIYNEEWGLDWAVSESPERQAALVRAYDLLRQSDPSRPIVDNSGWWHVKSDLIDWHYYDMDMASWERTSAALAADPDAWFDHQLSAVRFSQTQLNVEGHANHGKPILNGEYGGGFPHNQGWLFRWQTMDLRRHDSFAGYIYTEFTDVEHEVIGIYDAHRRPKHLGCDPADVNAETVLILEHTPLQPGLDYLAPDGCVELGISGSHHGVAAIVGRIEARWTDEPAWMPGPALTIEPFVTAPSVRFSLHRRPADLPARLHLRLLDADGAQRALLVLDVAASLPPA